MTDVDFDPANDPEMQASYAGMAAAREQDNADGFLERVGQSAVQSAVAVRHWVYDLPKNITVGVMDAAMNTADFVDEASQAADASARAKDAALRAEGGTSAPELPPLNTKAFVPPEVRQTMQNLRDHMTQGDSTSDEVTQMIAQYMLPFFGYAKALGGLKAASLAGTVGKAATAEVLTAGTVLKHDDGRFMDLVQLGRHAEGKFGDALRFIAPDGSAANAFVDYMTSNEGDTPMEGRFKNVIDNLIGAGVLGGMFYTAAKGLKLGRVALENFGQGPVGKAAQEGKIGYHGSQADFDRFDHAFAGTGEGAQAYGYGTYIAEVKDVAGSYRMAGGPRINTGSGVVHAEEMDGLPVAGSVKDLLLEAKRQGFSGGQAQSWIEKQIKTNAAEWGLGNRTEAIAALDLARTWKLHPGTLYHVEIPDEDVARMLDWDKPLSEQPEILAKMKRAGLTDGKEFWTQEGAVPVSEVSGGDAYQHLKLQAFHDEATPWAQGVDNGAQAVSQHLDSLGIPGIRYMDQQSRGAGKGTNNYVVFDPKTTKILKKE